jgi:isopentenyldiphosphate isomerase
MEIIDLYDHHRHRTGETWVRGTPLPHGRYRCVVHICVFNSKGQLLIQQRQKDARSFSELWDVSVGGGVGQGETSQTAATRELFEELGLEHDFSAAVPALTVSFREGFDDFFIIHRDISIESLQLQPQEVQDARWADIDEILTMIDCGSFIPYRKSLVDLLFFFRNHKGVHDQ